jgi:hypothetical protein
MALLVVEVEDWPVLLEETTGARSSIVSRTSDGRIVAQVLYASRLPRIMAKQDYYCAEFYSEFCPREQIFQPQAASFYRYETFSE